MLIKFNNHKMILDGTGKNLGSALLAAGIPIDLRCSGKGICGRCEVLLLSGEFSVEGKEVKVDSAPVRAKACRTEVLSEDAEIEIPRKSLAGEKPKCAESFDLGSFELLPEFCGIAAVIDVGTTTIAVSLLDASSGEIIGSSADYNKQFKYGDNVVSRISFSTEAPGNLELLHKTLIDQNINPMLRGLCYAHNIKPEDIKIISVAGNTVMTHLMCNLSPASMGIIPFVPETRIFPELKAVELGISAAPNAVLRAVPAISGFIGGDITAGIVTSGIFSGHKCALLIDVGTNCETVLLHKKKLYACASAAGPAFEGAGVSCGSRGEQGAIEAFRIRDDLSIEYEVIGGGEPHGICGSGMIDFVAEAREKGLLNEFGRFDVELLKSIGRYINIEQNVVACKLTETGSVYMSEKDIESILKAKAAIFAGIKSLTSQERCNICDFDKIYLAGGFAKYINIKNAIKIGMLPELPLKTYQKIGNSSLAGAALHILDINVKHKYKEIIGAVNDIVLNTVPEFEMNYIDALMLP
jgi:uncharacterized 2Fe-2S/4Fe-4S cluster protein (DUF4445 family)